MGLASEPVQPGTGHNLDRDCGKQLAIRYYRNLAKTLTSEHHPA